MIDTSQTWVLRPGNHWTHFIGLKVPLIKIAVWQYIKKIIRSHFYYCPLIRIYNSKTSPFKQENIQKRDLRFVLDGYQSVYNNVKQNAYVSGINIMVLRHYDDVIMDMMASQITSLTIVYSTIYSGTDQRKYRSSAPLAFVRGIHRSGRRPVTRKMFPFDDVIMKSRFWSR